MNIFEKGQRVSIRWPLKISKYNIKKHEFILKHEELGEEIRWPGSAAPFFMEVPSVPLYLRPSHYLEDLTVPPYIEIGDIKHTFYFPEHFGDKSKEHSMFWNTYYLIPEDIEFDEESVDEALQSFKDIWLQEGIIMYEGDEYNPVMEGRLIQKYASYTNVLTALELEVELVKVNIGDKAIYTDDALDIDIFTDYLFMDETVDCNVLLRSNFNRFFINSKFLKA